jgi:hypothetical protein
MNDDRDIFTFDQFAGLRNTVDAATMEPGDLVEALNVDITDAKRIVRRKGFGAPVISSACHSLWVGGPAALVVRGTDLLQIMPDYSTKLLRSGLTADAAMSFVAVGDRVFFSNGYESGVVQDGTARPWGVAVPQWPSVAVAPGSLRPGRYQYVTTYVDDIGQESGARRAGIIDLTVPSGLAFTGFGTPPGNIAAVNLYLSQPDGDTLYLVDTLSPAATAAMVSTPRDPMLPLTTQFLSPPPAGTHLAYVYGRIYVAVGNRVYYSEPFAPELFDLRKQYPLESTVTMLAGVSGGVYIGTETDIGWVDGADPEKTEYTRKAPHGVVPGSLAYGPVDDYAPQSDGMAAYFTTTGGILRGSPGGTIENLTRARYTIPTAQRGAAVVRQIGGVAQYLAVLQG